MIFHTSGLADGPLFGHPRTSVVAASNVSNIETESDHLSHPFESAHVTFNSDHDVYPLSVSQREQLDHFENVSVQGVHVSRLFGSSRSSIFAAVANGDPTVRVRGSETLKSWMGRHTPLPPALLKSFCHQLLHACVALEQAGLTHTDLTMKNILVFPSCSSSSCHNMAPDDPIMKTEEGSASSSSSSSSSSSLSPSPSLPPLLKVDGHYFMEKADQLTDFDHDEAAWCLLFTPRHREGKRWKNLMCSYMYCVLDMCFEGRFANLRHHAIMHCMNMDSVHLSREFRSMLECASYLLHHRQPMVHLFHHPYFSHRCVSSEWMDENENWHREWHQTGDHAAYLHNINSWYATQSAFRLSMTVGRPLHHHTRSRLILHEHPIRTAHSTTDVIGATQHPRVPAMTALLTPSSSIGHDFLSSPVCERGLLLNQFTCIQAPPMASSHWMRMLASSQVCMMQS
jgi:hypothetical protein